MRYKLTFVAGFATGYVLGAQAGRERYDELMRAFRQLKDNPSVQETAGVLQAQATSAFESAKRVVSDKVTTRVGGAEVTEPVPPPAPYPTEVTPPIRPDGETPTP